MRANLPRSIAALGAGALLTIACGARSMLDDAEPGAPVDAGGSSGSAGTASGGVRGVGGSVVAGEGTSGSGAVGGFRADGGFGLIET